jgi:predicted HTH transcriptional regulator
MEVPTAVEGWTFEVIERLVGQGYLETDFYDFKAELKGKDPGHMRRLTNTACAFANTKGGFLVFGVKDLDSADKAGRIEGILGDSDLAKEFGDKIRMASPSILFEFSNPPIPIKNSKKVLFVVQIPTSPNRPHVTPEGLFYYRTNEGKKLMSYEQVRDGFLRYEERRTKIKLLLIELVTLEADAKAAAPPPEQGYSVTTLDTTILSSILPDVYS